jgi:hypothetical protein
MYLILLLKGLILVVEGITGFILVSVLALSWQKGWKF